MQYILTLEYSSLKHLWGLIGVGKITKKIVRKAITLTVAKNHPGPKTYLLNNKEAYMVSKSEIYGAHGIPIYVISLANEKQHVLHGLGKRRISK